MSQLVYASKHECKNVTEKMKKNVKTQKNVKNKKRYKR